MRGQPRCSRILYLEVRRWRKAVNEMTNRRPTSLKHGAQIGPDHRTRRCSSNGEWNAVICSSLRSCGLAIGVQESAEDALHLIHGRIYRLIGKSAGCVVLCEGRDHIEVESD